MSDGVYLWFLLQNEITITAQQYVNLIQVARRKDAINDWGSIVALSYIAAQRTLYGYNDMAVSPRRVAQFISTNAPLN